MVDAADLESAAFWAWKFKSSLVHRSNSSEVEHLIYIQVVGGSIPSSSITHMRLNAYKCYLQDVNYATKN